MSGSYKRLPERKIRMIETWRTEVKSNQNYCTCSRLSLGSSKGANEVSGSTSITAVGIDSRPPSSHQSNSTCPVTFSPMDTTEPMLSDKPTCPVCQLLVDQDISLKKLREHGETGLVRKGSPRSSASLLKLEQYILFREQKTAEILKNPGIKGQFLSPFIKLKGLGLKAVATSRTLKVKVKRSLRSLKTKKSSPPSDNVGVRDNRPRATEIYAQYRLDASSAGSVETLAGLSDDERRRPELTIDESAARLRRAARLLDRASAHIAIENTNDAPRI
ncbi:hypothetical protein F4813DRAFT_347181 [Daldinia decipiens]|uniref:uncharacterized protein n=1 Tax=Daldinia decipiens TaxID=326647 RepID=UPI0020C42293|nr:uncharacterized protein F4813DRAFT_347181 [Daldinia decipiens]KAI1661318.1 hypothetical protein F4813DRAFT_347181 [Daldinia decipiens]